MSGLWQVFADAAERWPARPIVVVDSGDSSETLSYRDLREQAEAFARILADAGVGAGDRCALLGENSSSWIAACLGIQRLNAVAVPIDRSYSPAQIGGLLDDCAAAAILCSPAYLETGRLLVGVRGSALRLLELAPVEIPDAIAKALPPLRADPQPTALILYTSGTTADPKGVVITHANMMAAIDGMTSALSLTERDSTLGVLPLFHILGLVANLFLPLSVGALIVQLEEISAVTVLRAMGERRITILCSVPQFFYLIHDRITEEIRRLSAPRRAVAKLLMAANGCLRDRLGVNIGRRVFRRAHASVGPDVRLFVSAGAVFDPRVARSLHRLGFSIIQAYGLTESTGAATLNPPHDNRLGTVGKPMPGVSVAVRSPSGEICAANEEGEIALAGATLSPAYHNRPDATASTRRDGWFHTGDLGHFDADGHLHITGRIKDMIVLDSGKKIHPEEIEHHLDQSTFIRESCVIGRRSGRGNSLSEVLHAVVVPDMEALRAHQVVNIREHLRHEVETVSASLPTHQRLKGFDLSVEDLPRTTTRKIKRFLVTRQFQRDDDTNAAAAARRDWSDADRAWAAMPTAAAVLALLLTASPTQPAEIHPDDSLELDLGFDSLSRVELMAALEQSLGIKLEARADIESYDVRDLVGAVELAAPRADGEGAGGASRRAGWPEVLDEAGPAAPLPSGAGLILDAVRRALLAAVRGAATLSMRLDVRGLTNLPEDRPYILCANHQSYLDGFLMLSVLPYGQVRRMVLLGESEYFSTASSAWFADRFNIAVVDPDANLVQAMRASARALREGRSLLLFPEGQRSIDGDIRPLRRGAAILACHLGVPIVPLVLDGPHRIWPRGGSFRRLAPVTMRILPPIEPPAAMADFDEATMVMTKLLEDQFVATLLAIRAEGR